jgi:hypothetical protein
VSGDWQAVGSYGDTVRCMVHTSQVAVWRVGMAPPYEIYVTGGFKLRELSLPKGTWPPQLPDFTGKLTSEGIPS